jgi:hypothetical protein
MKQALLGCLLQAGFLLGLFFSSEDGDDMSLQNFCCLPANYTLEYLRRWKFS